MKTSTATKIKVLLVDDHDVVRDGVRLMLSSVDDIEIESEARSVQEAASLINERHFDVALIDISMPGQNGLELIERLRAKKPEIAALIFSIYSEKIYAIRALKLGAAGYLTKNAPATMLVNAIRKVASGGKFITPEIAEKLADTVGGAGVAPHEILTMRELEVLRLIAAGEKTSAIGKILNISPHTVATYKSRIFDKTGLRNERELFRYVFENSLFV
jgi:DNA-binding NarL/FixJ family response regulator